jgi:branched-chain amino acid transport system substrate-binding protein
MSNNINRRRFLTRAGLVVSGAVAGPSLLAACGGDRRGGDRHVQGRRRAQLSAHPPVDRSPARYQLWADR